MGKKKSIAGTGLKVALIGGGIVGALYLIKKAWTPTEQGGYGLPGLQEFLPPAITGAAENLIPSVLTGRGGGGGVATTTKEQAPSNQQSSGVPSQPKATIPAPSAGKDNTTPPATPQPNANVPNQSNEAKIPSWLLPAGIATAATGAALGGVWLVHGGKVTATDMGVSLPRGIFEFGKGGLTEFGEGIIGGVKGLFGGMFKGGGPVAALGLLSAVTGIFRSQLELPSEMTYAQRMGLTPDPRLSSKNYVMTDSGQLIARTPESAPELTGSNSHSGAIAPPKLDTLISNPTIEFYGGPTPGGTPSVDLSLPTFEGGNLGFDLGGLF